MRAAAREATDAATFERPGALAQIASADCWPVHHVIQRVRALHREYREFLERPAAAATLAECLVVTDPCRYTAPDLFRKLRWGGLLVCVSRHRRRIDEMAPALCASGFDIEAPRACVRKPLWGLRLPLLSPQAHYIVARKVHLLPPGEYSDRFTYSVRLVHHPAAPDGLPVVLKEVPDLRSVVERLQRKFPQTPVDALERRARKFTEKIFPVFLTRETGILKILQERLPPDYARRVPKVIQTEKDQRGFVRRLWMTWLRNGGRPISQLEFARQSADLLRVIHDVGGIIHLDLRLDNFVITEHGVGFVDFGSAVRENEDISANPLLSGLFQELMRTSQIQRMLYQMTLSGHVTSDIIRRSHQKVDKAVDFFYLAVQFNCPHANPDLVDLIQYDPSCPEAHMLARLTAEILRPADPARPTFRSAKDILHGIERIQLRLAEQRRNNK